MIYPIYIDRTRISSQAQVDEIEKKTGRPVLLVHGNPHEIVLDTQEELRDRFALAAMQSQINGKFSAEQIAESSYIMANEMMKAKEKKV